MNKGKNPLLKTNSPYPKLSAKKNLILVIALFAFNYVFHYFFNAPSETKREIASVQKNWTQHRHTKKGTVTEFPTIEKLKKLELYRKPKKEAPEEEKFAEFEGRKIMGSDLILKKEMPEIHHFINERRDDWAEKAAAETLRFHDDDTELFIEHKNELIIVGPKGAQYVEQAVLTFVGPNKKRGFSALIDSATGAIIQTWGSDITENYRRKKEPHSSPDSE